MRILLIDNDPATARSIEVMLAREDMSCATARSGEEGIDLGKLYPYDLIVLDLHLPDMSGHEVLRQLRRARVTTPVLILTGDDRLESRLTVFHQGADDVLVKPAHREELLARARALIRRSRGHAQSVIQTGALAVDLDRRCATIAGQTIALTGKEYRILELLALRRGTTVTKDMILNHLYSGLDEPEGKIVDVFLCKLRKKLARVGAEGAIQTVWGQGYCLCEPTQQQCLERVRTVA